MVQGLVVQAGIERHVRGRPVDCAERLPGVAKWRIQSECARFYV